MCPAFSQYERDFKRQDAAREVKLTEYMMDKIQWRTVSQDSVCFLYSILSEILKSVIED